MTATRSSASAAAEREVLRRWTRPLASDVDPGLAARSARLLTAFLALLAIGWGLDAASRSVLSASDLDAVRDFAAEPSALADQVRPCVPWRWNRSPTLVMAGCLQALGPVDGECDPDGEGERG